MERLLPQKPGLGQRRRCGERIVGKKECERQAEGSKEGLKVSDFGRFTV